MHHEPKIPEKATHSSSASQVAMQSCCLACPSRKSNTRFGLPGFPHFFPFLDVSAITELCKSDTSSTVKAFAAPSKRINVNVVVVKKRRVPCSHQFHERSLLSRSLLSHCAHAFASRRNEGQVRERGWYLSTRRFGRVMRTLLLLLFPGCSYERRIPHCNY